MEGTPRLPERLLLSDLEVRVEVAPARSGIRLTVERDATVTARVPPAVDADALARVIDSRSQWLHEKLAARRDEIDARVVKRLVSGERFAYLGRGYRLRYADDGPEEIRLVAGRLRLRRDRQATAAELLVDWYVRGGRRWLPRRVEGWARVMSLPNPPLTVRPLGHRWGSCGSDGTVNIHWATMQLPVDLLDYVLVHELAHLSHRAHTLEFWRTVEKALPGAARRREQLRLAGAGLWFPEVP
ncbi:SprT family zinc-dependent metalloprotease [Actinomadura fulvescens]|uniref:SprT family zinc-dependent metalloprotease n=2 Tax=Actinomadura fulvescens TaxID=46160 RepID=A0ABN3PXN0_9ACTN